MNKKLRSYLSVLMALCLLVGICGNGLAVLAEDAKTNRDDKIVYVSIGDSMTNGYGIDGYDGNSGVVNYAMDTFANQFAAWLAGYDGPIVDDQVIFEGANGIVDHRQLAMSGMRAEDIHWLLELDHTDEALIQKLVESYVYSNWEKTMPRWYGEFGFKAGDYRTWGDLVNPTYRLADGAAKILATYNGDMERYFKSSYATEELVKAAIAGLARDDHYPSSKADRAEMGEYKFLQIAAEFYQDSVKNADVITLTLGNTNFGTYMFGQMVDVIYGDTQKFAKRFDIERVYDLAHLNPVLEKAVRVLIDELGVVVDEKLGSLVEAQEAREALKNIVLYCCLSYLVNYVGSVEAILALNPDVEIIQVALINAYKLEEQPEGVVTLGDVVDVIYEPLNAFIAGLPTLMQETGNLLYEDATFYYSESNVIGCMVEVYGDDFYKVDGQYIKYPGLDLSAEGIQPNGSSVVRNRFMEYSTGKIFGILAPLAAKFGIDGGLDTSLTVETVNKYEMMTPAQKVQFAAVDTRTALSCALYLAFENAIIRAGQGAVTMDSIAALGNLGVDMFAGALETFNQNIGANGAQFAGVAGDFILSVAMDMAAAQVEAAIEAQLPVDVTVTPKDLTADPDQALENAKNIIKSVLCAQFGISIENFDAVLASNPVLAATYNNFCNQYGPTLAGGLIQGYQGAIEGATSKDSQEKAATLCMLLAMPQTLADAMVDDVTVAGVLCMAGRCDLGTGIGGHPSPAGHATLLDTILSAYEGKQSPADKTATNVQSLFDTINKSLASDQQLEVNRDSFRVNPNSHYLALGDTNAYGPAADQLAAKWGISYQNATAAGQTAAQLLAALPGMSAEIAKADLITVGFSINPFTQFAIDRLQTVIKGGELAPLPWEAALGAEGAAHVDAILAELRGGIRIEGNLAGLDMNLIIETMLESYAFAYAEYAMACAGIEKVVHAINPKAQLALIGLDNPLDGVILEMNGNQIRLGEYLQFLVTSADLYSLGYSYITALTDFIAAPHANNVTAPGSQQALPFLLDLLKNGAARFVPTAEGYAYIAARLERCITFHDQINLGDVDGNGKVNPLDAMQVLRYYTGKLTAADLDLSAADYNGDGKVNPFDAMQILRSYTGAN